MIIIFLQSGIQNLLTGQCLHLNTHTPVVHLYLGGDLKEDFHLSREMVNALVKCLGYTKDNGWAYAGGWMLFVLAGKCHILSGGSWGICCSHQLSPWCHSSGCTEHHGSYPIPIQLVSSKRRKPFDAIQLQVICDDINGALRTDVWWRGHLGWWRHGGKASFSRSLR